MGESGGVEKRENSIRIVFSYQGKQVKETLYVDNAPLPPTPANVKYAKRMAAEIRSKLNTGDLVYGDYFPKSPRAQKEQAGTLSEFLEIWYAQLHLKSSTMTTYRRMKDGFWRKALGDKPLKSIKHSDITRALKAGTWESGKTRNNHLSMIANVFALAVADDLIEKNPCDKIEQASWQKKKVDPFTLDEANRIIASIKERYPEQVANFYEFMFFSGLRTGEGIGLEWSDIDFNKKTALIKQAYVVDALEDTKTSRERTVNLNSRAMDALKRQKAYTFMAGTQVFHDPGTGKPWAYEQNARKRYWAPTLKLLGIRYRRPYYTRHTYATVGLMAGVNPAYMAKQLGHGIDVFFKDYSEWINGKADDAELSKIEEQIGQIIPKLSLKAKKPT